MPAAAGTSLGLSAAQWAGASAVAGLAGTAITAAGQMKAGEAQANQMRYQAQVAANNEIIAKQNKAAALAKGNAEAERIGLRNAAIAGAIKADQGAKGVDVNTGSNVEVQKSQRELSQLDAENIRLNAAREAYGYEIGARDAAAEQGLRLASAEYAEDAALGGAAGTIIGGAASVGSKYAMWLKK